MKVNILELRDMVADAIRLTVEARGKKKAPKEIPQRSEESVLAQRDRNVRATGYSHSPSNDFSKPLGVHNLAKRQGAAGMGNWTSEAADVTTPRIPFGREGDPNKGPMMTCKVSVGAAKRIEDFCKQHGWHFEIEHGPTDMAQTGGDTGLDDPKELGIEGRVRGRVHEMQVRKLVRMVVGEEMKALRGRR